MMSDKLEKWTTQDSYAGYNPAGHFLVYSRNRDSSILEDCNYSRILKDLRSVARREIEPEAGEDWVYDFRASHWAVGWVEYILIRPDAPQSIIDEAESIVCALADYPVLCEDEYSDAQYTAIYHYWERIGVRERVDWCKDGRESIFAARRSDEIPEGAFDCLREAFH